MIMISLSSPTNSASPTHLPPHNSESPSLTFAHLADADLPPPGPDHFAARRALWTTPTATSRLGHDPSPSRVRLESLLNQPGALESPEVWDAGLSKVWKGLVGVGGGKLKSPLPLRAVVKILYAGWRRDGTWPDNATVVDDDAFFGTIEPQANNPSVDQATPLATSSTSVGSNAR
ncbi:hypothetical protein BJV78DRAFT_1212490 [Lactifluus subvellereus]|nr:hypothetical protein BJV78DRAFT_1212490 [Lactifluus subvellereus]